MKKEIRSEKVLVSPEQARKWLEKNVKNRTLRPNRVAEIAGWMTNKQWEVTTDAIGFDVNGNLINGQHRLSAVVKVNKPFEFLVVTGLEESAFNVIDTVKVRSATDVLGVNDFSKPGLKSAIARFMILYQTSNTINSVTKGTIKISNQMVLDFANKNKNELELATIVASRTSSKFRGIEIRYIGGLFWLFSEKDPVLAETFFRYYEDGVGLSANDPILILRQKLIQNLTSTRKVSIIEKLAWVILAWNYIRSGKKIKVIRWNESDGFPKPI